MVYVLCRAAKGEVTICRVFFENFSGDQVSPQQHVRTPCIPTQRRSFVRLHIIIIITTTTTISSPCTPQVRFLARSFAVPGDHCGQTSHGYRWPYGPVAIISPFNFPLEIPILQVRGWRGH
jgi:hypothetical protein